MPLARQDLMRHLWHMGGGLLPPFFYGFVERSTALVLIFSVTALVLALDVARLRNEKLNRFIQTRIPMLWKEKERSHLTASTLLLIGCCLTTLLIPDKSIARLAMVYLAVGDSCAAITGKTLGCHKLLNGRKSVEGTVGGFLANVIMALLLGTAWWGIPAPVTLIGAVAASLLEFFPTRVDDNISLPVGCGLLMLLVSWL
jgi:dolichol kinase